MSVVAYAHPNIALIKYWGKSDLVTNMPSAGSLSVTLDTFSTQTQVEVGSEDHFVLNGQPGGPQGQRIFSWLDQTQPDRPPLVIRSSNNFPTAAGLASSASGFAALTVAVNVLLDLKLSASQQSVMARRGSGSAARSIFGGFVALDKGADSNTTFARPLVGKDAWPLKVVIAVTAAGPKKISSSRGMEQSRLTSPYYDAWNHQVPADLKVANDAIESRDFEALAQVSEGSFLAMHAVMISSRPGLLYMKPASLACIERVRELRAQGIAAFCTMDAGPQVKIICQPDAASAVESAVKDISGVLEVHSVGLGDGAYVEQS
ncbi:MAG: diphosphomevalonate decarboxylase [Lysobacterales bacterium]